MIKTRRTKFIGYEQHNTFIMIIKEEKINGKRERGRPRDRNLWNIKNQLSQNKLWSGEKQTILYSVYVLLILYLLLMQYYLFRKRICV